MKKKDGLILRQVKPTLFVLEDFGSGALSQKMITFNSTAAYLWDSLKDEEFTTNDIVNLLIKKYSISADMAKEDSDSIISAWQNASIIE
ncbi:MAG: PqqD family protein [Bacteroidaceae bacterium]|nr:PqqD family protein [Bacteroidaceae bacterium]